MNAITLDRAGRLFSGWHGGEHKKVHKNIFSWHKAMLLVRGIRHAEKSETATEKESRIRAACQEKKRGDALRADGESAHRIGNGFAAFELYAQALNAYARAILLHPKYSCAYIGKGKTHMLMGKLHDAIDDYTGAISIIEGTTAIKKGQTVLVPTLARAYKKRATAKRGLCLESEAEADLKIAIGIFEKNPEAAKGNPDFAKALNALGEIRFMQGKVSEAGMLFDRALAAYPDFEPAAKNLKLVKFNEFVETH